MSPSPTKQKLCQKLEQDKVLRSELIKQAFLQNDRAAFVPEAFKKMAYADQPLPLSQNQTISQPTTAIFMLELLKVKAGQQVLDIGYGSGWVTAMLAFLVGFNGQVYAAEINPIVAALGRANLRQFNYSNIKLYTADYQQILKKIPQLDRITCAAAFADEWEARPLIQKLKTGGRLIFPTADHDLRLIKKNSPHMIQEKRYSGFTFVPITH